MEIALPKGRLLDGVTEALRRAGITWQRIGYSDRCYAVKTSVSGLGGMIVKVRAIPQLVALGSFDLGFCGLDLVQDSPYAADIVPIVDLNLNAVRIVAAAHESQSDILLNRPRRPVVIATEYEGLAAAWALSERMPAIIVNTYGSTEGYAPRKADIVFDCVETGDTMRANGLVVIAEIMRSSTWLVTSRQFADSEPVRSVAARLRAVFSPQGDGFGSCERRLP